MAISLKGYHLISRVEALRVAQVQRSELSGQLQYWEEVIQKHQGYRDAYFKAAVLSYQLGEKAKAKRYLEEVLALDPNFREGRDFGEQTGLL